ncbi:MAG: response regulator [Chloroflexi bacterium]|nr:response regulator [Chloroflexota bacterium]
MPTKKKILLVDDERGILKVLSIKLRVSGYDVVTAADGQEALKMVDSASPDLMLLDVIMPGIDGFEVLRKLRPASQLPVIVCSARPSNMQEAMNLGANDFLAKPFNVDDLVKRIELLLDHKGPSTGSAD